jgi:nucleotide-binding universal stress UspA family protein
VADDRSRSRIVVGVDGSQVSLRALHWAAAEAARRGTGLDVVHAWGRRTPCF